MRIKVYIAQKGSTGGRTSKVVELRLHGKDKLTRALKRLEPGIMIHVVLTDLKDHQTMSVYGAGLGISKQSIAFSILIMLDAELHTTIYFR